MKLNVFELLKFG